LRFSTGAQYGAFNPQSASVSRVRWALYTGEWSNAQATDLSPHLLHMDRQGSDHSVSLLWDFGIVDGVVEKPG